MATRLRGCVRAVDTAARFGGGEFAGVAEEPGRTADVRATAARIVAAVAEPVLTEGRPATVTAGVGIALNRPGDTTDPLREADVAMDRARTTGECRHVPAAADRAAGPDVVVRARRDPVTYRGGQRWSEPAASMAARPASSRATGTRNGEQDT